ncbi:hypothetical protein C8Q79DRAFT_630561 [Trametes meyenii]|nr:hypothetical protein C8Q79DRAFT_630561 [Trametes meyenii]
MRRAEDTKGASARTRDATACGHGGAGFHRLVGWRSYSELTRHGSRVAGGRCGPHGLVTGALRGQRGRKQECGGWRGYSKGGAGCRRGEGNEAAAWMESRPGKGDERENGRETPWEGSCRSAKGGLIGRGGDKVVAFVGGGDLRRGSAVARPRRALGQYKDLAGLALVRFPRPWAPPSHPRHPSSLCCATAQSSS